MSQLGLGMMLTKQNIVKDNHESQWDTTKTSAGSSNSDQIKLPLESDGTYDFTVYWGDGSNDSIDTWNQAETTHTYDSGGVYNIIIVGTCEGFRFDNTGDKLKLLNINNNGYNFKLGNNGSYFYGCENLVSVIVNTTGITNMTEMFRGCTTFNGSISNFDTSSVTNMSSMFHSCNNFNQSVSNFNTSNVTTMFAMFYGCSNFNQSVSNFNTSNVKNMFAMFHSCANFNQSIVNFNIESVTNISLMLSNATSWSTANYDAALIEWADNQDVVDGLDFDCSSYYTSGGAAEAARTSLINDDSWDIDDLGAA